MYMHWPDADAARADLAACHLALCNGSRSFYAASFLLPRRLGEPSAALYAFCRLADDAVDRAGDSHAALARLYQRLDRVYAGRPLPESADRAFATVVARFGIPRTLPEALLEGFHWDAENRRYETLSELYAYSARVAGSVGAMMAVLMGARAPEMIARACDLGVAMQLTNIARDVGEDARMGRLYLPLEWMEEAGIDPDAWLARPAFDPALGALIRRLLRHADVLYRRAGAGIARLPLACRPGMYAARYLYAEIGRELERRGLDSVSHRAVVPARRKAVQLSRALAVAPLSMRSVSDPPLAETRFLVEAVSAAPLPAADEVTGRIEGRVVWLLDLFERLERRQRGFETAQPRMPEAG